MRKKSSMQNNGGYSNKKRYSGGGGGGGGGNGNNRPRKNYGAAREKYLSQARDALSSGDRVLAENFYQHAEHCYRMMVEEGHHSRHQQQDRQPSGQQPSNSNQQQDRQQDTQASGSQDDQPEDNASGAPLPAFLTSSYSGGNKASTAAAVAEPATQDWED